MDSLQQFRDMLAVTVEKPAGTPVTDEPPQGRLDNANTVFRTLKPYENGSTAVRINGRPCTDYIECGYKKLNFGVAPHPDDHILVDYTARSVV